MGNKLSDEQIARYERDGFVFPVGAFGPERTRHYGDCLEAFERHETAA